MDVSFQCVFFLSKNAYFMGLNWKLEGVFIEANWVSDFSWVMVPSLVGYWFSTLEVQKVLKVVVALS
jgi:hypothetical protein